MFMHVGDTQTEIETICHCHFFLIYSTKFTNPLFKIIIYSILWTMKVLSSFPLQQMDLYVFT